MIIQPIGKGCYKPVGKFHGLDIYQGIDAIYSRNNKIIAVLFNRVVINCIGQDCPIFTVTTDQNIYAKAAIQNIIASTANQNIIEGIADQKIIAAIAICLKNTAPQNNCIIRLRPKNNLKSYKCITSSITREYPSFKIKCNGPGNIIKRKRVRAKTTDQEIISCAARNYIVTAAAINLIISAAAKNYVVAIAPI